MRLILATSVDPFVKGGAQQIVEWLGIKLREKGHEVEVLEFPHAAGPEMALEQILAMRFVDVSNYGDRLIAIRPPSYALRHPHKIVWFIHHYRSAYDLWQTRYCDIADTPEGVTLREAIVSADTVALGEAKAVYANSMVTAARLQEHNGIHSSVLYPPLLDSGRYWCGPFSDYVLYISRLTNHKRQWLAIEAIRHTRTPVKLLVAGPPDPRAPDYACSLNALLAKYKLEDRVQVWPEWISEDKKRELFANSLAVAYFPVDEDSYGYPCLEACHSGKPVITTTDAGGTSELITDGVNGFVADSRPEAVAAAFDQLFRNRLLASQMGRQGTAAIERLRIGWDNVLAALLS